MLLMKPGPAFQETWNLPRGVACTLPGGPGSARTGPKMTLPADWSQVMCLVRSTHAVAAAGQDRRSAAVSVNGSSDTCWAGACWVGFCVGATCWPDAIGCGPVGRAAAAAASLPLLWLTSGVARGLAGRGEATAAEITTTEDAAATASSAARRRAG